MFKKRKKDADLFIDAEEDWTQQDQNESVLHDDEFEAVDLEELDNSAMDITEESDEDESRYQQHLLLKKQDKIFNNSWNNGDGQTDETYQHTSIKLDPGHSDSHLLDASRFDQYMDKSIVERDLNQIIREDAELSKLLDNTAEAKKFTKAELNLAFSGLCNLVKRHNKTTFISPIDVLDFVSMIAQLDYKRLFESLEYEHKEILLLELNKKFGILEGKVKFKKLF